MTKREKQIVLQATVMLEELKMTTKNSYIKEEAERLIKLLRQAAED